MYAHNSIKIYDKNGVIFNQVDAEFLHLYPELTDDTFQKHDRT